MVWILAIISIQLALITIQIAKLIDQGMKGEK